jgi:hypothetical protein
MIFAVGDKLIDEIRENYHYASESWRDIRSEAARDMRYLAGDPWKPEEKKAREDANRPFLALDELNQFVNQLVNDVRQSPRSAKVTPNGQGSSDKTAEVREEWIRAVEYRSHAQAAYITGFQSAVERSYGFWRISTEYAGEQSFDQDAVIRRIPNADSVVMDPDAKELDFSDASFCFLLEWKKKSAFKREWPKAKPVSFAADEQLALAWERDEHVLVAEYWKVLLEKRRLLLIQAQEGPLALFEDELPEERREGLQVLRERDVMARRVVQYFTNGSEVLEENEWLGNWIPIIGCVGKEMWLETNGTAKRMLMSLVRLARDPYMLYCYYRTCEAELVAMTPKTPFIGAKGQFEGMREEWSTVNQVPRGYLEYNPVIDQASQTPLPPPQRPSYVPAIQPLELGAESARRAIQAAMGSSPMPTAALRRNEKSGVALERIDQAEDLGTFHFIHNYELALEFTGRQLEDLFGKLMDTPRDVHVRKADGETRVVRVNDPAASENFDASAGRHDVNISIGPSYQSQREAAADFADSLAANPQVFPLIADLVVKMKGLGPIGDEIADRLRPPQFSTAPGQEPLPPAFAAAISQARMTIQQLQQQLAQLLEERRAKTIDLQAGMLRDQRDNETRIAIAEIQTKSQEQSVRDKITSEIWRELHRSAHEAGQDAVSMLHELRMAHEQRRFAGEQAQAAVSREQQQTPAAGETL